MSSVGGRLKSEYDDWHTPSWVVETATKVMGRIDLDPASNELANKTINAFVYYNKEDNGLNKNWFGNVFLNPPGGKTGVISNSTIWWNKALIEYNKGNLESLFYVGFSIEHLCINPTMLNYQVCFLRNRLKFIKGKKDKPTHSNFLLLMSRNPKRCTLFNESFNSFGKVVSMVETEEYIKRL